MIAGKTFEEWQEFARKDYCLDQMVPSDLRCILMEIGRLRAALIECGAPYLSPPTTVMGASAYVAEEFERRMNIAANTLNDGTRPAPTAND